MTTREAWNALAKCLAENLGDDWSWHTTLTTCAVEEGIDPRTAVRIADRFTARAFGGGEKATPEEEAKPRGGYF